MGDKLSDLLLASIIAAAVLKWEIVVVILALVAIANIAATVWATRERDANL